MIKHTLKILQYLRRESFQNMFNHFSMLHIDKSVMNKHA